jgi:hypothetical protein
MQTNKLKIFTVSLALCLPVDILGGSVESFSIPLSIILLPSGLINMFVSKDRSNYSIYFSIAFALLSALLVSLISTNNSYAIIGSIILFFSPISMYFLSSAIIKNKFDFYFFLDVSVCVSFVFIVVLWFNIITDYGGMVRGDGVINGSFLGLSIYGAYGIHTFAAYLYLLASISFINIQLNSANLFFSLVKNITLILILSMIVLTFSRELILSLILALSCLFIFKFGFIRYSFFVILTCVILFIYADFLLSADAVWYTQLNQTLNSSSLNEMSSGRLDILNIAIQQLIRYPLTGTGFHGFNIDGDMYIEGRSMEGWSPHNYYITVLWKMGLPAGGYYIFLILSKTNLFIKKTRIYFPDGSPYVAIAVYCFLIGPNLFWDALLAYGTMALFSFMLGSLNSLPPHEERNS